MIVNHKEFQIYINNDHNSIRIKKKNEEIAMYKFNYDYIVIDHPYIFLYDDKQKFTIKMEDEGLVFDMFDLKDNVIEELGYMRFEDY